MNSFLLCITNFFMNPITINENKKIILVRENDLKNQENGLKK